MAGSAALIKEFHHFSFLKMAKAGFTKYKVVRYIQEVLSSQLYGNYFGAIVIFMPNPLLEFVLEVWTLEF